MSADPWRIGTAQYATATLRLPPRRSHAFPAPSVHTNRGNAWLMHGKYGAAAVKLP